jgi:two-component system NtrC family sensor kinase
MTIRLKLTLGAIAILLVANSVLSLVNVKYVESVWLNEVQNRVRLDLNSARAAYANRINDITHFLQAVALDRTIAQSLRTGDREPLAQRFEDIERVGGMDFLVLVDAQGRAVYRPNQPDRSGDDLSNDPLVAASLRERRPASGTVVFSPERLAVEGEDLAERARFQLLPTTAARPTHDTERDQGMVIAAAVPLVDADGQLAGLLYAGHLLNRSEEIVDAIKAEVLPRQLYQGRDIGAVTIFLGDLRISTNVHRPDGQRALGTRLSEAVYNEVLHRGETWAGPAFVVNDWYLSAYEPIRDPAGQIVGALYVGLLQAPFVEQQNVVAWMFLIMVSAATVASLLLFYVVTLRLLRPIGQVIDMAHKVVKGDLSARVGVRTLGEMGALCQAVDEMANAVAQREEQLKLITRQQMGRSEKLASIGRLAAGVAHEINNPLTGVLTFAHLLREKSNMDPQDQQDLDLIIHETSRAADIVRGLLDFARERAAMKEPLDINHVIIRTLRLIRNQKSFDRIKIIEELQDELPEVNGDMNQLQQVFLNLSLNACEAMPAGGTITVRSRLEDGKVRVQVIDTGCGIKREYLDQIYEPFFSTKPIGKGTGLGLSVSYGIIQQHGGTIEVESEEGQGTTFTLLLPAIEPSPDSLALAGS